jgi:hypothetical protein
MSEVAATALNVVILCALGAAIFYAFTLSRQLKSLQADRKGLEALITSLNIASAKADAAARGIRAAAEEGADALQKKINTARALSDELEIIVEAGDNLAERLARLPQQKPVPQFAANEAEEAPAPVVTTAQPRSRAEKELLEALRAKQRSS